MGLLNLRAMWVTWAIFASIFFLWLVQGLEGRQPFRGRLSLNSVLSVRIEVDDSLLLAPAEADKRGLQAPYPLVGYAGIQPVIHKRVPTGAPAGDGSYWKHWDYRYKLPLCHLESVDDLWDKYKRYNLAPRVLSLSLALKGTLQGYSLSPGN